MSASHPTFDGYPTGWFCVAFSDELAPDTLMDFQGFGRGLMAYRAEDGSPVVADAHCPHLGANIAHGGLFNGGRLKCPFHGWEFSTDGKCVSIPYCEHVPPKARLKTYPAAEVSGMILMWFDPAGKDPTFEFPGIDGYGTDQWTPWVHRVQEIKTRPREVIENIVDVGHFLPVHNVDTQEFESRFDGHMAIQESKGVARPRGGGVDRFTNVATYHGPGILVSEMDGYLHSVMVGCHIPLNEERILLRLGVTLDTTNEVAREPGMASRYADNLMVGFYEDIDIWEHKVYLPKPLLCAGDGPLGDLRRWYTQFYRSEQS